MSGTASREPFRIRRLDASDFGTLLSYDWDPLVRERDTIYLFLTQDHPSMCFVAEDAEGNALGYVIAARSADGRAAFILHVHVRPDARGRGMGRALMERFETSCRAEGLKRIWLLAGKRARGFYERVGYVQSRELLHPEAARHVGSVKNALVLVKGIAPPSDRKAEKRAKHG